MKPKIQIIYWFDSYGKKIFQLTIDDKKYSLPSKSYSHVREMGEKEYRRMTSTPGKELIHSTFTIVDGDDPAWIEGDYP